MLDLNDAQWCILDMLMSARKKGITRISRQEILTNELVPVDSRVNLTWAALTMPDNLISWVSKHEFAITERGIATYNLRFDKAEPTNHSDVVIYLPDQSVRQ